MRLFRVVLILLCLAVPLSSPAANRGTPAEAKALLGKAVAHYGSAGRTQALADFTAGKPPFRDRDLYVVCIASDHSISANGAFPQYVGMAADILKDASGKPLGRAIVESVATTTQGTVSYMMMNPMSGKVEPKILYAQKVSGDVCGVGAYNGN
jgi:hypothetical protein